MRILDKLLLATGLILVMIGMLIPVAWAQDDDEQVETLDLTMTLMPEGATLPDAVTRIIELPASAAEAARQNAVRGLVRANSATGRGDDGAEGAEQAGEQGRERAQQAREDAGRGPAELPEAAGSPPGQGADPPAPPDPPGRPDAAGGAGQGNN